MLLFRSKRIIQTTTASLIFGLVIAVFSGSARAEEHTMDYSSWVTLHLPSQAPVSVLTALEFAAQSEARSLNDFLETFLTEIKRTGSEDDVAEWLYGKSVNHSIVWRDLRLRLIDVVSAGILYRIIGATPAALNHPNSHRAAKSLLTGRTKFEGPYQGSLNPNIPDFSRRQETRYLILSGQPQGP